VPALMGVEDASIYLPYFLPILWIAAATVVALLLYRTSKAFVEHRTTSGPETRRVRLVGSIAIALVVFVVLWRASPSLDADPAAVTLAPAQLRQLDARRVTLAQAWMAYEACLDVPGVDRCPEEKGDVDVAVRQFNAEYAAMLSRGTKP